MAHTMDDYLTNTNGRMLNNDVSPAALLRFAKQLRDHGVTCSKEYIPMDLHDSYEDLLLPTTDGRLCWKSREVGAAWLVRHEPTSTAALMFEHWNYWMTSCGEIYPLPMLPDHPMRKVG